MLLRQILPASSYRPHVLLMPRPISGFKYWEASAVQINPTKKEVICRATCGDVNTSDVRGPEFQKSCELHTFAMKYDYLVLAVGAVPNTFNIPGCELSLFPNRLKLYLMRTDSGPV